MISQKGGYGRYINTILIILDFLLINIVFVATCIISPGIIQEHARITMFLVNISYIPIALWTSDINSRRTIYMDHIILRSIQVIIFHALILLSLSYALKIIHMPIKSLLIFYGMLFVSFPIWRSILRLIIKFYRRRGKNFKRIIIVGCNPTAKRLYNEINTDAGYGYKVVGFFGDAPIENNPKEYKYLGTIDDLENYITNNAIDEIYYTLSGENEKAMRTVTRIADNNVIQFYYVPQLNRYFSRSFEMHTIGPMSILSLRNNPLKKTTNRVLKRTFDIIFSSIVLLIFPIILIPVAILIKISSPGPVFFKQKRTGYRGKDFYCWKFRTMRVNADCDKKQAQKDDPRKTRVGDFLRRTSIDELPQFINVFKGDMSVVGPRPHMLKHTQDYSKLIDKYMVRHFIKPGITGWAQVSGYRGLTEELWQMENRVKHDVWYIENWTFMLDLKIIVKTIMNAVQGEKNAF